MIARTLLHASAVIMLIGATVACSNSAKSARDRAFTLAGVAPPMLAVDAVIYQHKVDGFLADQQPIGILFSRPVEGPLRSDVEATDQDGKAAAGSTRWLDGQMVVFYPTEDWTPGRVFSIRTKRPIPPIDKILASLRTRPLRLNSVQVANGGDFLPLSTLRFGFEGIVKIEEMKSLALIHEASDPAPIPFEVAKGPFGAIDVTLSRAVAPGKTLVFGWKTGTFAILASGAFELDKKWVIKPGLKLLRIGDPPNEQCTAGYAGPVSRVFYCRQTGEDVHLSFSSPIGLAEVEAHVHVGKLSTVRLLDPVDGASARLVVSNFRPVSDGVYIQVTLDAELTDVFGSTLGKRDKVNLKKERVRDW